MKYQVAVLIWVFASVPLALIIGLTLRTTGRSPKDPEDKIIDLTEDATQAPAEAPILV